MPKSSASVRDLSPKKDEKFFEIKPLDEDDSASAGSNINQPDIKISHIGHENVHEARSTHETVVPKDIIRVKFGSFVQLVANRDMEEMIELNGDQELIMSSNLLTELASVNDRREEKKIPIVFLVGIAIGVVLTYIFFST
jgi:hypothetical protein